MDLIAAQNNTIGLLSEQIRSLQVRSHHEDGRDFIAPSSRTLFSGLTACAVDTTNNDQLLSLKEQLGNDKRFASMLRPHLDELVTLIEGNVQTKLTAMAQTMVSHSSDLPRSYDSLIQKQFAEIRASCYSHNVPVSSPPREDEIAASLAAILADPEEVNSDNDKDLAQTSPSATDLQPTSIIGSLVNLYGVEKVP